MGCDEVRVPSRNIVFSTKMRAILPAFDGMMPCQPRYGRMPTNSRGLKVRRIATQLVLQPTNAATSGMLAYLQKSGS
jgi:hypothetical protein